MRILHPSLGHQSLEDHELGSGKTMDGVSHHTALASDCVLCRARKDLPESLPFRGESSEVEASWLWAPVVFQGWSGRPGQRPYGMGSGRGIRWLQGLFLCCPGFCLPQKAIFFLHL